MHCDDIQYADPQTPLNNACKYCTVAPHKQIALRYASLLLPAFYPVLPPMSDLLPNAEVDVVQERAEKVDGD